MKKMTFFLVFATMLLAAFSCAKENKIETNVTDVRSLIEVTLVAENPTQEADTRTEMEGKKPYWSAGETIGVVYNDINTEFVSDLTERSAIASFHGTAKKGETAYAYHPYREGNPTNLNREMVTEIPSTQYPTATSFDGSGDILLSKPFSITGETIEGLVFQRFSAVVRIVFVDNTEAGLLSGQHLYSVSLTAEEPLVGWTFLDLEQQTSRLVTHRSKTATALYNADMRFEIGGSNATYLAVYPIELSEGAVLKVDALTEDYRVSRELSLPRDLHVAAGKITTLKVKVADEDLKPNDVLFLPFRDDLKWANASGNSDHATALDIATTCPMDETGQKALYSAYSELRKGLGGLMMGRSSSSTSSLTTGSIDLSGDYSIIVKAENHPKYTGAVLNVYVDDALKKTVTLFDDYFTFVFPMEAATSTSKVKLTVKGCAYLREFDIVAGQKASVIPETLQLEVPAYTSEGLLKISHEHSAEKAVKVYSDPDHTDECTWMTARFADNGDDVSWTVEENTTRAARNAFLVITAGNTATDDTECEVIVSQAPSAHFMKVTTAQDDWSGDYVIASGNRVLTGKKSGAYATSDECLLQGDELIANQSYTVRIEPSSTGYTIKMANEEYGYFYTGSGLVSFQFRSTKLPTKASDLQYYQWNVNWSGSAIKIKNVKTSHFIYYYPAGFYFHTVTGNAGSGYSEVDLYRLVSQ